MQTNQPDFTAAVSSIGPKNGPTGLAQATQSPNGPSPNGTVFHDLVEENVDVSHANQQLVEATELTGVALDRSPMALDLSPVALDLSPKVALNDPNQTTENAEPTRSGFPAVANQRLPESTVALDSRPLQSLTSEPISAQEPIADIDDEFDFNSTSNLLALSRGAQPGVTEPEINASDPPELELKKADNKLDENASELRSDLLADFLTVPVAENADVGAASLRLRAATLADSPQTSNQASSAAATLSHDQRRVTNTQSNGRVSPQKPNLVSAETESVSLTDSTSQTVLPESQGLEKNCWTHLIDWSSGDGGSSATLTNPVDAVSIDLDSPIASSQWTESIADPSKSTNQTTAATISQIRSADSIIGLSSAIQGPSAQSTQSVAHQVAENFVKDVSLVNKQGSQKITMHLHPAELGRLTVEIGWESDLVSASIVASEKSTSEILNRDRHWLVNSLVASGFELSSFDVSHDSSEFQQGAENEDQTNEFRQAFQEFDSSAESQDITSLVQDAVDGIHSVVNVVA